MLAKLDLMVTSLSRKAGLQRVPGLSVCKSEQFVSVNVFSFRICVGERFLSLWRRGVFSDCEVESAIAHEFGHLMDFRGSSGSSSFGNLVLESAWLFCGIVPVLALILFPSNLALGSCLVFSLIWGVSIPFLIKRFGSKIEFEADRNAALHLIEPACLASTLEKIKGLTVGKGRFAYSQGLTGLVGKLTHPSLDERISRLHGLSQFGVPLMKLWQSRVIE